MKNTFSTLILLAILGAIVYNYREILIAQFFPPAPCSQPIPYELGTFDTKFGISKDYLLKAIAEAEAIWEKPKGDYLGKNLFAYMPNNSSKSVLKINLVYDDRQEATDKLSDLGIIVKDNRASYDMLKAKWNALKAKYTVEKNAFDADVASFNKRQKALDEQVKYWNGQGGAPRTEYNKLTAEDAALAQESKDLQTTQVHLNKMVDDINAMVTVLNNLASTLNISVNNYNTVGSSRGETFEEGLYESNGLQREIDIYEFSSRAKLVRVLAHEFGHALGLEHVKDSKSIMYEFNQGTNTTPSATDLSELKTLCGI